MEKTKSKNTSIKPFDYEKVKEALFYVQDKLERASIPFIVLKDMAKLMIDQDIDTSKISEIRLGILERHATTKCLSILRMVLEADYSDNKITFSVDDVPVRIDIIHKRYKFLDNPDTVFFSVEEFKVPNPFDGYWKSRGLVK